MNERISKHELYSMITFFLRLSAPNLPESYFDHFFMIPVWKVQGAGPLGIPKN
jgi:hypothetical protein